MSSASGQNLIHLIPLLGVFPALAAGSAFRRCRCPFDTLRHCGILLTHSFIHSFVRPFARSFTHFICYFPAFPALRPGRSSTLPGPALESAGRFSKSSLPWPEGGLRDPGLCARSGLAATRSLFCKGLSADRAQRCVCVYQPCTPVSVSTKYADL